MKIVTLKQTGQAALVQEDRPIYHLLSTASP